MKLKVNKFSYLAYVIAGVKLLEVTITKIVAGHAPGMDPIKNVVLPQGFVERRLKIQIWRKIKCW